jgi:hypothetical protein
LLLRKLRGHRDLLTRYIPSENSTVSGAAESSLNISEVVANFMDGVPGYPSDGSPRGRQLGKLHWPFVLLIAQRVDQLYQAVPAGDQIGQHGVGVLVGVSLGDRQVIGEHRKQGRLGAEQCDLDTRVL